MGRMGLEAGAQEETATAANSKATLVLKYIILFSCDSSANG
jgi:hypothetical protein